jgi:hypothetical protein
VVPDVWLHAELYGLLGVCPQDTVWARLTAVHSGVAARVAVDVASKMVSIVLLPTADVKGRFGVVVGPIVACGGAYRLDHCWLA